VASRRRAEPAALGEARARHAGHYGEVLARADELYRSGVAGVLQGLALFDAERVNIEAGHHWVVGRASRRTSVHPSANSPRVSRDRSTAW
jgi:hypothetical protein